MSELARCETLADTIFTDSDPQLHQVSLDWSKQVHADPSTENVERVTREAYRGTLDHYSRLEPHTAHSLAANMARAVVARVAGHFATIQLAPIATQMLEGDPTPINAILDDVTRAIDQSTPGFVMDFGRTWYGDDARLMLSLGLLTEESNYRTLENLPQGIRYGLLRTGILVKHASTARVKHLGLEDELKNPLLTGNRFRGNQAQPHSMIGKAAISGKWSKEGNFHSRHLIDSSASGLSATAEAFLERNTITSIEHIVGLLTDVYHEFNGIIQPKASPVDIQRTILGNLYLAHMLAFMSNQHNGRAEYGGRYVWQGPNEAESMHSSREPLVRVGITTDHDYTLKPNAASKMFANMSRAKRRNCPGPDALAPRGAEEEIMGRLQAATRAIVYEHAPGDVDYARLDRHFSHIDTLTILAAAAARLLMERGFLRFDDVHLYLGPPEEATSNGPYTLGNPVRRSENQARLSALRRAYARQHT